MPSYLPSDSVRADSILVGTAAKPALTAQEDTVDMRPAGGGSVRATITGPSVPAEGLALPDADDHLHLHRDPASERALAQRPCGLRTSPFGTILGCYSLRVVGTRVPPAVLASGRAATFSLGASLSTGEGLVRWAPDGSPVVASWDFVVETD